MKKITYTSNEVENIAQQLLSENPSERIFLLKGTLGAGKTTLIKAFCEVLGVTSDLSSPSFSIINEYADKNGNVIVYHADLYRLKSLEEAEAIGLHEYLDSGKYCFIEWFEILESYVSGTKISIEILPDGKRQLSLEK